MKRQLSEKQAITWIYVKLNEHNISICFYAIFIGNRFSLKTGSKIELWNPFNGGLFVIG